MEPENLREIAEQERGFSTTLTMWQERGGYLLGDEAIITVAKPANTGIGPTLGIYAPNSLNVFRQKHVDNNTIRTAPEDPSKISYTGIRMGSIESSEIVYIGSSYKISLKEILRGYSTREGQLRGGKFKIESVSPISEQFIAGVDFKSVLTALRSIKRGY